MAVRDLDSRNGVLVNGQQILPDLEVRLQPGDVVEVGKTRLQFNEQQVLDPGSACLLIDSWQELRLPEGRRAG